MGWANGSSLFNEIITIMKKEIPEEESRTKIYEKLILVFENHDWDTQDECLGQDVAYDKAIKRLHPGWMEDEDF